LATKEKESAVTTAGTGDLKKLILYNSGHVWNDVIFQLQKATGFDIIHCEQIALIAHTKGKATVKSADFEELCRVDRVLREIELVTEIV
jgi:hypothetical protein